MTSTLARLTSIYGHYLETVSFKKVIMSSLVTIDDPGRDVSAKKRENIYKIS